MASRPTALLNLKETTPHPEEFTATPPTPEDFKPFLTTMRTKTSLPVILKDDPVNNKPRTFQVIRQIEGNQIVVYKHVADKPSNAHVFKKLRDPELGVYNQDFPIDENKCGETFMNLPDRKRKWMVDDGGDKAIAPNWFLNGHDGVCGRVANCIIIYGDFKEYGIFSCEYCLYAVYTNNKC